MASAKASTVQIVTAQTLTMQVKNPGFLVDLLGKECGSLQFVRELTQNSIEANLKNPNRQGQIIWDLFEPLYDVPTKEFKTAKLCVKDTGLGMSRSELAEYINKLSSSSSIQTQVTNYGVGAKIAAATRNPFGLIYLTWKDGQGSMAQIWKNPDGDYGFKQLGAGPDGPLYIIDIPDQYKPKDLIRDHGTVVVLMGDSREANTMQPPAGTPQVTKWISRYLNARYFRLPDGINIKTREGRFTTNTTTGELDKEEHKRRTIRGQEAYLNQYCESRGSLPLTNAKAHWWILPKDKSITDQTHIWAPVGHVAALYQNELYEMTTGRQSIGVLQDFGITLGYQQVVIYVEPDLSKLSNITTNTARTRLSIDDNALPWHDLAAEFREKMPKEIVSLIETASESVRNDDSHEDRVNKRLDEIRDFLIAPTRKSFGEATGGGNGGTAPGVGGGAGGGGNGGGTPPPPPEGTGGDKGFDGTGKILTRKAPPVNYPKITWLSIATNSRRANGDLENRAARYLPATHELQINEDFYVFTEAVDYLCKLHKGQPGIKALAQDTVREWYGQSLKEVVVSAKSMTETKKGANDADASLFLTEVGLTTGIFGGHWLHLNRLKTSFAAKVGKGSAPLRPDAEGDAPQGNGGPQPS